jgi:hypothetical protein
MAQNNGSGGIYIGAGWVLTAGHVGPGDVSLDGVTFPWDGTYHQLTNTTGDVADGTLFHLKSTPNLPRIPLVSSMPPALSPVDFIGFGFTAGSAETSFGLGVSGFYWSTNTNKSWGNNQINPGGPVTVVTSTGTTYFTNQAFNTVFSSGAQTSDEAQGANFDSGGGVFYKNGSVWELAGVLIAIDETLTGRPYNTAVYGDLTFALDVATYRDQILAILQATPVTLSITPAGSEVQICWTDTGATYNLEATDSIPPSSWTVLAPALSSTNGQICALLPATNRARFFRLQKQ